jgi:hypothetical protein
MQQERNRVIEGMQEWKQKEQLIADLFSPATARSNYVQQLKLEHLRELRQTLGKQLTSDEQIVLCILRAEIIQLYRHLYPNPFIRFVAQLARSTKALIKRSMYRKVAQVPEWKLKVPGGLIPQQKQTVKLQPKAAMRPMLVQKKNLSQRKGMRIN